MQFHVWKRPPNLGSCPVGISMMHGVREPFQKSGKVLYFGINEWIQCSQFFMPNIGGSSTVNSVHVFFGSIKTDL